MDPLRIEQLVEGNVAALRRALGGLRGGRADQPIRGPIARAIDALGADDPLGALPWLCALEAERLAWPDRVAWAEAIDRAPAEGEPSFRSLRHQLLETPARPGLAEDLARACDRLQGRALDAVEQRVERDRRLYSGVGYLTVADADASAPELAEALLEATDELPAEATKGSWVDGLHLAVGAGATEGWPARLLPRWLATTVTPRLFEGLEPKLDALPRPCGASSFARALGALGVAILEAGRPAALPLGHHVHPSGVRRHVRRALFGSLVGEPTFASRVLGLGGARGRDHARTVARAAVASLRIDAWRVLSCHVLVESGRARAIDRHVEFGVRVLGAPPPAHAFAVLPELHPGDAAGLVGSVLAASARQRLVDGFDEDWFRNPRAADYLRHVDSQPREPWQGTWQAALDELVKLLHERV